MVLAHPTALIVTRMDAILVHIQSTCHVQLGLFIYIRGGGVGAVYVLLEVCSAERDTLSLTGTIGGFLIIYGSENVGARAGVKCIA